MLLEAKQQASVQINGLWVPIDSAKFSLERFSRPLWFHNTGTAFEVSVSGTCALMRRRGENFLIATRHQLGKGNDARPETEACIALYDDPKSAKPTLLTPSGSVKISYHEPGAEFLEDLLILTFEREKQNLDKLNAQFLQIDAVPCLDEVDPARIIQFSTVAFPSIGNRPQLNAEGLGYEEFRTGFSRLALEPSEDLTMDHHLAFRVKEATPKARDFDGFSGSPVYFLFAGEGGQAQLGWAGIVRLGGNGILHVYLASEIRRQIDTSRSS